MGSSVTALVPFYAGDSDAAHSPFGKRREWLDKTIDSLESLGFFGSGVVGDIGMFPGDPVFLPARFLRWAQGNVDTSFVYVTEADQVLTLNPEILEFVSGDTYLVPHRRELHDGVWVFPNSFPHTESTCVGVYDPGNRFYGFGGAFLCTRELFDRIVFTEDPLHPVESSTGFDVYGAGVCRKTCRWEDFWVHHLSGDFA